MEEDHRKRLRRDTIKKCVLASIKVAGLLSIAALAPNALQALKIFGYAPHKRQKEIINLSRVRLIKAGLVEYKEGFLSLTAKGETKLRELELADYQIKKPKRWDKKWRVLIFDIKEERRPTRDKIRRTLGLLGFARLQDSVWVYPYDCEDLISLLKADFKIGKDLLYMIVDSIENDRWLRTHFGFVKPSLSRSHINNVL